MRFGNLVLGVVLMGAVAGAWQAMGAGETKKTSGEDPYLWLEDVHGEKPLAWVKEQNARSLAILKSDPDYQKNYDAILSVLDASDRIPMGRLDHNSVFNFWQDAGHPKGLWRRTTIADYANAAPHWEILLDIDKLAADEHENWVWGGADCAPSQSHCLVNLSRGGGDAHVVREFDLASKTFLPSGFALPEAKSNATYVDEDTVLFGTDFGKDSLTASGYPRIVKLWHRGAAVADAKTVLEGKPTDVSVDPLVMRGPDGATPLVARAVSFFQTEYYRVQKDGSTRKLPLPLGADVKGVTKGNLIFTLREDWSFGNAHFAKGSLLAMPLGVAGAGPTLLH